MDDTETETKNPLAAEIGAAAVDMAISLERIAPALTAWAQEALERSLRRAALDYSSAAPTAKAWLQVARAPFPAGWLRLNVRVTAAVGEPVRVLTEEHHAMLDLTGLAKDAASSVISGVMLSSLGELVDLVAPRLIQRMMAGGVLVLPDRPCAGSLCVGCGSVMCPRSRMPRR